MEKTQKKSTGLVWYGVQSVNVTLVVFLIWNVLVRAHWRPYIAVLTIGSLFTCFMIGFTLRKMNRQGLTADQKLDVQWVLIQLTMVVLALLIVSLEINK